MIETTVRLSGGEKFTCCSARRYENATLIPLSADYSLRLKAECLI
jgi:hypothetical protein